MTPPVQMFPNAGLAWAFVAVLVGLLFAAGVVDYRTLKVPKPLSLALLVLGFLFSVIRMAWNAAEGVPTWHFPAATPGLGAVDGVLFALEGFAVGFGVFFCFWILGIAGGGDLKVVAALGTWLGPYMLLGALFLSFFVVVAFTLFSLVAGLGKKAPAIEGGTKARKRLMSYTLPLAIATLALCLAVFQYDLGLSARQAPAPAAAP